MDKTWKPIEGFPNYEISNFGQVRDAKTKLHISPVPTFSGELAVPLVNGKHHTKRMIKYLVAQHFLDQFDGAKQHLYNFNGDLTNNHVDNLMVVAR